MGAVTVLIISISILSLAGFVLISFASVALYRFLKDFSEEVTDHQYLGFPDDNLKKTKK